MSGGQWASALILGFTAAVVLGAVAWSLLVSAVRRWGRR